MVPQPSGHYSGLESILLHAFICIVAALTWAMLKGLYPNSR